MTSRIFVLMLIFALMTGCNSRNVTPTTAPVDVPPGATLTPSELPPTPTVTLPPSPTPEPLALRLGDWSVSLAEYEAEMLQLKEARAASGKAFDPMADGQVVFNSLADSLRLARAASENGYVLDESALQTEIDRLTAQAGGTDAFNAWMKQNGYSDTAFRRALRRSMAAAWQRDQIAASVPLEAEQVHVRQIFALDEATANETLRQLNIPGVNFAAYAYRFDPQTGGELGWFPKGYLVQPEVEAAAFALETGKFSPVVHSAVGYHIVQLLERAVRPLSPDAYRALQVQAIQDWLAADRDSSQIENLLP